MSSGRSTTAPGGLKIELVPWDPSSEEHARRMHLQRLACGWRSQEVPKWRDLTKEGTKMLYWAVLGDGTPNAEELLAAHLARYPAESAPIHDTASACWLRPRPAAERRAAPFVPVGHVALDLRPEADARLGAAPAAGPGVRQRLVWIAGLYVSWALQGGGVGRAVMRAAEAAAAALPGLLPPAPGPAAPAATGAPGPEPEPEQRVIAVLDAIPKEQQLRPDLVDMVYVAQGNPPPALSNEEWYLRQGYEPFRLERASYVWQHPETGEEVPLDLLYFRKRLA